MVLFGRLTHVAAIWNNLLAVPVGRLPEYLVSSVTGALTGGEVLTVLVTFLIIILGVRLSLLLFETRFRIMFAVIESGGLWTAAFYYNK